MGTKNILMIMCDQLRKDCLGFYGNPYIHTPNLDALAAQSVVCTQSFVANPICMPNRLSIFSGMLPRNHGLWTNGLLLQDEGLTLPHHLSKEGYRTASIGKIHFEPTGCSTDIPSREADALWDESPETESFHGPFWGFDYIELMDKHSGIGGHYRNWFYKNGGNDDMLAIHSICDDATTGVNKMPPSLHASAFVGQRTAHYLREHSSDTEPFFLVASFPDPHHPFNSPEACYSKVKKCELKPPIGSPQDLITRPNHYTQQFNGAWSRGGVKPPAHMGGISDKTALERTRHTYAMVELIDENVGLIISALKESGHFDDTIILFTSDHGELLGDHGLWTKGPFFYDGLLNTPLMVHAPDTKPAICSQLISSIDIAPTLCQLVGVDAPYYADGLSQASTLISGEASSRKSCLIEYRNGYGTNDRNCKVLITPQWKLVVYQDGESELTDRINDPLETTNIADKAKYASIVDALKQELLLVLLQTESKKPAQHSLA